MAILVRKDAVRAFGGLGHAFVFGTLMLLVMEGVVTPASGFTKCVSSFGLRYKTRLGGNPLMTSSFGSIAPVRRDSACRKNKGPSGWRMEKVSECWWCSIGLRGKRVLCYCKCCLSCYANNWTMVLFWPGVEFLLDWAHIFFHFLRFWASTFFANWNSIIPKLSKSSFRLYMEAVVIFCFFDGRFAACHRFEHGFLLAMGSRGGVRGQRTREGLASIQYATCHNRKPRKE